MFFYLSTVAPFQQKIKEKQFNNIHLNPALIKEIFCFFYQNSFVFRNGFPERLV